MGAGEYVSVRSQRELLEASTPDGSARDAVRHLDVLLLAADVEDLLHLQDALAPKLILTSLLGLLGARAHQLCSSV